MPAREVARLRARDGEGVCVAPRYGYAVSAVLCFAYKGSMFTQALVSPWGMSLMPPGGGVVASPAASKYCSVH